MSEVNNPLSDMAEGESLTFSAEQIEYLREEFERQRRWVNLLSTREKTALEELVRLPEIKCICGFRVFTKKYFFSEST